MKIGVLGCGYWGKNHVRSLHGLGSLAAVADEMEVGRERATQLAPSAKIFSSLQEMIDDGIQGVVIATPAHMHFAQVQQALEAGLDVLVEKPLTLDVAEGFQLDKLAREKSRILMVGHLLAYHPAVTALRDYIQDNQLGSPSYVYSNRLSFGLVRQEENVLWSFAPHDIDLVVRFVGSTPSRVLATGQRLLQSHIEDICQVQLEFSNGSKGHIFTSWLSPVKEQRLVLTYADRILSFDGVQGKSFVQKVDWTPKDGLKKIEAAEIVGAEGTALEEEHKAFIAAVETRCEPATSAAKVLPVSQVLHGAQLSLADASWHSI